MKTSLLISLFISISLYAGDWIGNGGGIAENNILFAYNNLETYIDHCLKLDSCEINSEQESILIEIKNSLREERKNKNQVIFAKGPIFRRGFEYERFAVTGNKVGSPIYINKNLLYTNFGNRILHTTIAQAVSIFTHEFGHHHGISDEVWLNNLGAKVAKMLKTKISYISMPKIPTISVKVIQTNTPKKGYYSYDNLMLSDQKKFFDLKELIKKVVTCPSLSTERLQLKGLSLWQAYWSRYNGPSPYLKADLTLYCQASNNQVYTVNGNYIKIIPIFYQDQGGNYRIKDLKIRRELCRQNDTQCLSKNNKN